MHIKSLLLMLSIILPGCVSIHRDNGAPSFMHVLFIGNSLTYTNDLPGMLEQMSADEPRPLSCASVTFPGVSLAFHRFIGVAAASIKRRHWDYVILQDYSTRPLDHPDGTIASIHNFVPVIGNAGAQPILFENWERRDRPGSYTTLVAAYARIQTETQVPVARIGEAWHAAHTQFPWFRPFVDERHPSPMGTYLIACVLFETIYQHTPPDVAVPRTLTATQAAALHEVAQAFAVPPPGPTTTTSK